jgi:hypothetical protein
MGVEFEEENISINTNRFGASSAQASPFQGAQPKAGLLKQVMMLVAALACVIAAFVLPTFFTPKTTVQTVYFEDITAARMRLIPEAERDAYISSLPSRKTNTNN